ncbi:MAG: hypothetical protein HRU26_12775, partial [Psychroserpens sp.]|nr:hypothetical protein [Psychroserpens sp.]
YTTTELSVRNPDYSNPNPARIAVKEIVFNTSSRTIDVQVLSTSRWIGLDNCHLFLDEGSQIQVTNHENTDYKGTIQSSSDAELIHKFEVKLKVKEEYGNLSDIALLNDDLLFIRVKALETSGSVMASYNALTKIKRVADLKAQISANTNVHGKKDGVINLVLTQTSNKVELIFDESPLDEGLILKRIQGIPQGDLPSTIFSFNIESSSNSINYGEFKFHFEGNSSLFNNPMMEEFFVFSKIRSKVVWQSQNIDIKQIQNSIVYKVEFDEAINDVPRLFFPKSGDKISLVKSSDPKIYEIEIDLSESFLKQNIIENNGNKFVEFSLFVFDKSYIGIRLPVKVLDTEQVQEDLADLSGSRKRRKEEIKKYLEDKNFVENIGEVTDSIFETLKEKDKDKREWNWGAIAKVVKPVAGLLMLFI